MKVSSSFFGYLHRPYDRVIIIKDRKVIFEFDGNNILRIGYYHSYDEKNFCIRDISIF